MTPQERIEHQARVRGFLASEAHPELSDAHMLASGAHDDPRLPGFMTAFLARAAETAAALGDPDRLARELRAENGLKQWEEKKNPSNAMAATSMPAATLMRLRPKKLADPGVEAARLSLPGLALA